MKPPSARKRVTPLPAWLARLAHDLRDPITPLRYAVQHLQSGRAAPEDADALLRLMDRQIDAMLQIADEVSDLIKLERGEFKLTLAPAGLGDILNAAIRSVARGANSGAHAVELQLPAAVQPVIAADDARLAQLLSHLLRLVGAGGSDAARPLIQCENTDTGVRLHLRDQQRNLAPSARLDYLLKGTVPADPRSLLMSNLIAREVLLQHGARLRARSVRGEIAELLLDLDRAELPSFVAFEP